MFKNLLDSLMSYGIRRYGKGNIDLYNLPKVNMGDGYGTVYSTSFNDGKNEVLIPQIYDGQAHTYDEALKRYDDTGLHLGKFKTPQQADNYGRRLHLQQERIFK